MMGLVAAVVDERWTPGIGDPTVLGWATVGAYAVAFALCLLAFRQARRRPGGAAILWGLLAAMMLGLGINKQLDLQTWFSQVARDLIVGRGLYAERQTYQGAFIVVAALVGLGAMGGLGTLAVRRRWPLGPVAGATFLVSYVVVRAASFHHFDRIINLAIPGARLSSAIELVGIAIIGGSAARALARPAVAPPPRRPAAPSLIDAVARYRS